MHPLQTITETTLTLVDVREYDAVFRFANTATLTVECLWRLLDNDRIVATSTDVARQSRNDAAPNQLDEFENLILHKTILGCSLLKQTHDICVTFDGGAKLEIIPNSTGHEAWSYNSTELTVVAMAGGDMTMIPTNPDAG